MYQSMWYAPGMGKGAAGLYIENFLLPISPNLEQSEMDKPMARVGNDTSLTPAPPVSDVPVGAEPSEMITLSWAGSTPENSPDRPAPLRHWTQTTNFLWGIDTWLSRQCWTDWHLGCIGWSTYQSNHGVLSVYCFPEGVKCNMHSTCNRKCLLSTTDISIQGNTLNETSQVDSWAGKGPVATPLPMKNSPKVIPVEAQSSVRQHCPEKWVTDSHAKFLSKTA